MTLPITSIYAALLTGIFLALTCRVIMFRRDQKISVGDNGDKDMMKRMRAQANFVEMVPLSLVLLALAETAGAPALAMHLLGAGLFLGRVLHAIGFSSSPQKFQLRKVGILLNLVVLLLCALGLLGHAIF